MDTALQLKQQYDQGNIQTFAEAKPLLDQSELLKLLLTDFKKAGLSIMNRLVQLSEIPFTHELDTVKQWIEELVSETYCEHGFTFSGKADDMLSCYTAMITSVLIKLCYHDTAKIEKGIEWILTYQNIKRGLANKWDGTRMLKYGGCLKNIPCYIGVVKSVIALSDWKAQDGYVTNKKVEAQLEQGLNYILDHNLYQKHSSGKDITNYISKLSYPYFYKTNIVELMTLMKNNDLLDDTRCEDAKKILLKKKKKQGYWQANRVHLPKTWVEFDKVGEQAHWLSYEISQLLK